MKPKYQNFDPRPCPPGFFLSCGKRDWQHIEMRARRIHTLPPVLRQALPRPTLASRVGVDLSSASFVS